ncbi:MAG: Glu-tRNA(Gln) amidotransferase subunit GatE, partial [Planctomycetota bacterium]
DARRRAAASALPLIDLNPRRDPPLDFPDRELGELTPADYAELGFLCGLEVHQQLLTDGKLFCRCRAGARGTHVDLALLRHMRPTLSELGQYDGCALMEFKTRKEIVYQLQRSLVCTYEMDDTPPFEIDEQAVRIALEISLMFGLDLVSELQVMRKQYLDGSIPTGFQRTAMVGAGGAIPFRESELGEDRVLRIRQLTLEEDSCREISDAGHRIVFRTDRLGTPLIETVTEPDLLTPRDVEAGGRLLADVARASGKVRRGPGAARQDVNVSIAGSRRVEMKGVPWHRGLARLVHNEAYRQLNLLRIRAKLLRRGIDKEMLTVRNEGFAWESSDLVIDARTLLLTSDYRPVSDALERSEMVCAVRLPGFGGLLRHRTQPGLTFAHELAERVRVIACPADRPFLTSSDTNGLRPVTWTELRRALRAGEDDAVVVLWSTPEDTDTGAREVLTRAREAFDGVPAETRQVHADGTTGFERILPGPERMYPDTDTPPHPIPDAWVEEIRLHSCERPWNRRDRYRRAGLQPDAARRLAKAPWADLFDALAPGTTTSARRLAAGLEKRLVHWWRTTGTRALPEIDRLRPLVAALDDGSLHPSGCERVLDRLLREDDREAEEILAEHRRLDDDPEGLGARIAALPADRAALRFADDAAVLRWAFGRVVRPAPRGSFDPTAVRDRLVAGLGLDGDAR